MQQNVASYALEGVCGPVSQLDSMAFHVFTLCNFHKPGGPGDWDLKCFLGAALQVLYGTGTTFMPLTLCTKTLLTCPLHD